VRLLLDEHYAPEIARQLRKQGHDVVAVVERAELVGLSDEEHLRRMARERRAIMTNSARADRAVGPMAVGEGCRLRTRAG
jgi:hypothetical protein